MRRRMMGTWVLGAVLVGACGAAAMLGACSSSSSSGTTSGSDSSTGADSTGNNVACTNTTGLKIAFSPMYSAFVSDSTTHTFQVPAIVLNGTAGTATWTASDPKAVTFAADPANAAQSGTMMTVKAATSPVTITAQIGSQCGSAQLNITTATEADWQAGNARYNNGVPVIAGCIGQKVAPILADSGTPYTIPPVPEAGCPDAGPACTGCHGDNPTGGFFSGVQHTPEQTGGFSDQALTDIFVNAIDPTYDTSFLPYEYWHAFHTWTDISTPEQQKAMVVYLRSLPPVNEMGGVNFGNLNDSGLVGD